MRDETKGVLETAVGTTLALVGTAATAAAAIPGAVGIAFAKYQDRRVRRWWDEVVGGTQAAEQLVSLIEVGLVEEDENVIAGIVGGARAAANTIDLACVAPIARLSRRYIQERDIARSFYRAALELLEQLDASEVGALRTMLDEIEPINTATILIAADIEGEARPWQASDPHDLDVRVALTPFPSSSRLFGCIKRAGLGHESRGMGYVGSSSHVVMDRSVVGWLRDAVTLVHEAGDRCSHAL